MSIEPPSPLPAVLCDELVLAITGSPACLTMPAYVQMLRQSLVRSLTVMMTAAATRFLPASTMRRFAGSWVHTDLDRIDDEVSVPHIDLTRRADALLVMPATANSLGKAAAGICDDLVSTSVVACPGPVIFVPSMNTVMWNSRVVQRNVATLRALGHHVIEPGIGHQLADGSLGDGAMPPLQHIVPDLLAILGPSSRCDRRVAP